MSRTVFITGASGGIGRATALKFSHEGWNIICHYHSSKKKAEELEKAIAEYNVKCTLLQADLSNKDHVMKLGEHLSKFHVDSVINNAAAYGPNKHFLKVTLDEMADVFMANAMAPMWLTAALFEKMKERRFGRIVNVSSIAAKYGGSGNSLHYGASKRALEGLTKTLAKEGAEHNVLVNTVRPGVTDTEFHKKFPKDMTRRIAMIPVKRMGTAEEVADMIVYLGSEKNTFMTGEIFAVAGGE